MPKVEEEKDTALHGIPSIFIDELAILEKENFNLKSLRTGVIVDAICPYRLMKQINTKLHMSEVSPINTQTKIDSPFEKRISSVGIVHPHVEIKIINQKTGEILPSKYYRRDCTRRYSVMLGYWNDEKKPKK